MDISQKALSGLMKYLKAQIQRIAEKKIVTLREIYKDRTDLIENGEIIDQYVFDVLNVVRPVTTLESAYESTLIFEAVSENEDLKVDILSQIDKNNPNSPWFFTNTSSVPINKLESRAGLKGRILGFHFYNPPAVQRLVELIVTDNTSGDLVDFANLYAKNLKKKIVPSNDFAGFIGNGHFMRDALHAINEVQELSRQMPYAEAVYMMNKVSQEFLIRPMGIFQLIDYVGIDVCQFIMKVMNPYLPDEDLFSPLLDKMMELNIKGGQNADGSQIDGFLKYQKGRPAGIYDPDKKDYINIDSILVKCDEMLGELPGSARPWKVVIGDRNKSEILDNYFNDLKTMDTQGAKLAKKYALRSREIGLELVSSNVAKSEGDVNTVMLTGFYHVYGPINDYFS